MEIQRITLATSGDVAAAVSELAALAPEQQGFRDGDAWYHLDVPVHGTAGTMSEGAPPALRLAVSGPDGGVGSPTLLLRVADLDGARRELQDAGIAVGPVEQGAHERRFPATLASTPGLRLVLYSPLA